MRPKDPDWEERTKTALRRANPSQEKRDRPCLIILTGTGVGEVHRVERATVVGRATDVDVCILDDALSRRHVRFTPEASGVLVEDLGSTNGTFVNGRRIERQVLADGDKVQLGATTVLKFTFSDPLEEQFQRSMYESALRDGLTGAFNKRYLLDRLAAEYAYAVRHKTALSLVLFDIDHFKRVNDVYGHLAGDAVLVALAHLVSGAIRREDLLARYGGEEFAIIGRGIDLQGAMTFAERLRRAVEVHEFVHGDLRLPVTVSLGVAAAHAPEITDATSLVAAADAALYEAKRAGRNRLACR